MYYKSLNGKWQFKGGEDKVWLDATVPGCNYTDLMDNGIIKDPFEGMNEKDSLWPAEKNYTYKRTFDADEELMRAADVLLKCDMLDTLATVRINGEKAAVSRNCHTGLCVSVKEFLKEGENLIEVEFDSPVAYIKSKQAADKMPLNMNGLNGAPHIRKPQCHFGWDWGPTLPPSGIAGDIGLQAVGEAVIKGLDLSQSHGDGKAEIRAFMRTEIYSASGLKAVYALYSPQDELIDVKECNFDTYACFEIDSPELWWPNGHGEQPLYTVKAVIDKDGVPVHEISKRVGIRTIVLDTDKDEFGSQFAFKVNGVPVFAKGANWIPADSFITRFTKEKTENFILAAKRANMNMLRVWGGGYYESDDFYDFCDRYGIMVWQDFAFACAPYPFYDKQFEKNVLEEVEYNVDRLKHHACLALWCGNNEIEIMSAAWLQRRKLIEYTEIFFYHTLPETLKNVYALSGQLLKTAVPYNYIPGSPTSGEFMKKVNSDASGDTHLWSVWHGLQPLNYYRTRFTRFCSEFGLESIPDMRTVRYFAGDGEQSLTSPVFNAHQKCGSGNMKIKYYITTKFRLAEKMEDLVYQSQIVQAECVREATEHWRINQGRCNGSLFWQLNDCWPVNSWSSIDYFGRYKALQYAARTFNAPVTLSLFSEKNGADLYIINDTASEFGGRIVNRLITFDGVCLYYEDFNISAKPASSTQVTALDYSTVIMPETTLGKLLKANGYRLVMVSDLLDGDGERICRKTLLFRQEKFLEMPAEKISVDLREEEDGFYITLLSSKYQRFVNVRPADGCLPMSDNFFDLLPNEPYTVVAPKEGRTLKEFKSALSVKSLKDVVPFRKKYKDDLMRLKIFVKPYNLANWFYYKFT